MFYHACHPGVTYKDMVAHYWCCCLRCTAFHIAGIYVDTLSIRPILDNAHSFCIVGIACGYTAPAGGVHRLGESIVVVPVEDAVKLFCCVIHRCHVAVGIIPVRQVVIDAYHRMRSGGRIAVIVGIGKVGIILSSYRHCLQLLYYSAYAAVLQCVGVAIHGSAILFDGTLCLR